MRGKCFLPPEAVNWRESGDLEQERISGVTDEIDRLEEQYRALLLCLVGSVEEILGNGGKEMLTGFLGRMRDLFSEGRKAPSIEEDDLSILMKLQKSDVKADERGGVGALKEEMERPLLPPGEQLIKAENSRTQEGERNEGVEIAQTEKAGQHEAVAMRCRKCGQEIEDDAVVCVACGTFTNA